MSLTPPPTILEVLFHFGSLKKLPTLENLLASVDENQSEISLSTLFALACVLENVPFINGSSLNTFVLGLIDLAIKRNSLIMEMASRQK
ncbi:unnamed protein product [Trifolium pratense]|uniref:Uncharacterized protein n=1 Tax=Trifolium pratense TaxID=57577 RepID=A0ACB0K6K2_TRIPR|nr:unnamed protein product [Trifolium pratense]